MTAATRARPPALLAGLTLLAVVGSLVVGARWVGLGALLDAATGVLPAGSADHGLLVSRVARTAVGVAVGAALGLAGIAMQGMTRNPLADPGLLGINAGASLAMVLAVTVGVGTLAGQVWWAFGGAALAAVVVHAVATLGRRGATPVTLAIAGAAVTAAVASWTSAILLLDQQTMNVFRFWQVGTIGGRGLEVVGTVAPFLVVGAALVATSIRALDASSLGEDVARGLGRRTALDKALVALAVVLLAGGATALAGPIAFVGLIAAHVARALVGAAHARTVPVSALLGVVIVLLADTLGRVVLPPTEVQVGITTALAGIPALVVLTRGRGRRGWS